MPNIDKIFKDMFGENLAHEVCPRCHGVLREVEVKEVIPVEGGAEVSVRVPVLNCAACDFMLTDKRAEEIRDAGVRLHKGLLTAKQIKDIRDNLGFSRREFSEAFGIPPASMERWENGRLIQSKSNDTLLRALANKGTASALDRRRIVLNSGQVRDASVIEFRSLKKDKVLFGNASVRSQRFRLRRM
jgi:putative zinc finger/helix-turn-helix YgiT family protein